MDMLITNIAGLVQVRESTSEPLKGSAMAELPMVENAWLSIKDGRIADWGSGNTPEAAGAEVVDAKGGYVFPSFVDSHTHLVFAGSREQEFVMRIKGKSYEEIARQGGGILNSAKRLQQASEDELFEGALARLHEVISMGTGAIEIKSGYGLSLKAELKMLRVVKRLKEVSPIPIKATFLGAHAIPAEYKENREGYIELLTEEMLPQVAEEGLAEYVDVFCDRGFFTPEETATICEAGAKYGLRPKLHANELGHTGGIQVGVQHNAISVDHLEFTGEEELQALKASDTIPTLLPSTAFFLSLEFPPARNMIEAGLPVSLASDYNPGSSPSGNMPFVVALACIKMKMTPAEAINAATVNAAFALEMQDEVGSITRGKRANLFITKPIPSVDFIPYSFGSGAQLVERVVLDGKLK